MTINPDNIALALVTFSTVGFLMLLGTATLVPLIIELTLNKTKEQYIQLLFNYRFRLISTFGGTWSIVVLIILSMLFSISDLLTLIYFVCGIDVLLNIALYLSIFIVTTIFIYVLAILIKSWGFQRSDIELIRDYIPESRERN